MGHIVSAKATRLGSFIGWCDHWFSEKPYYPEFLHSMFRLRIFCYYIFTERHYVKKAIFMSHFEIYRISRRVFVHIFYYDGKWESEFEDYKIELFRKHYDMPMNKDPETRKPYFLISSLKFLILFDWIFPIRGRIFKKDFLNKAAKRRGKFIPKKFLTKKEKKIKKFLVKWKARLIKLFRFIRVAKLSAYMKRLSRFKYRWKLNKKTGIKGWKQPKFIYLKKDCLKYAAFLMVYINTKMAIGKKSLWGLPCRNTVFRRLYYSSAAAKAIDLGTYTLTLYMSAIFSKLSRFNRTQICFFLTNNNCVGAKFLSRFIAKKLRQGYSVKELLNPIRKELVYLLAISMMSSKSYYVHVLSGYFSIRGKYDLVKSFFKNLITSSYNYYLKLRYSLVIYGKIFITMDTIPIFSWINELISCCSLNNLENHSLMGFASDYFERRMLYVCFFENKFFVKNPWYLVYPKLSGPFLNLKKDRFRNFFEWLHDHFIVNRIFLMRLSTRLTYQLFDAFYHLGAHMRRFVKYTYDSLNYVSHYKSLNVNFLKKRIKIQTAGTNLMGYKMYLKGRFTRKQRAGHMWFSKGRTPLNTLSAYIDFAFYSQPLRNSTITVRLWLYKFHNLDNTYYYRIS